MNKRIIGILTAIAVVVLIVLVSADRARHRRQREVPAGRPAPVLPATSPSAATPAPMSIDSLIVVPDTPEAVIGGDTLVP